MLKFILAISFCVISLSQRIPLTRTPSSPIANANGIIYLNNLTNFQYQAVFELGSPAQIGYFVLDTAIGQMWINTVNGNYSLNSSTTANVSQNTQSLDYGMGEISGFSGTEQVSLLTANIFNITQSMIFANSINNTGIQADGVLGLSNDQSYINFFQGAVSAGQITNYQYGFYLKDPNAHSTAQFYICSTSFPTTAITWITSSMTTYWAVAITGTTVGATTYPAGVSDSQALIDSGTAMLLIGNTSFNGLKSDPTISQICQLVGQFYVCECPSYARMTYPTIQFQTASINLRVVPNDYMLLLSGGYCVMGVDSQAALSVMLLGDSLMNNYFVAYDKTQNRIGFSVPIATSTQSQVESIKFLSK